METEFNEGRLWHLLGLLHLAVPAYERCLAVPLVLHDANVNANINEHTEAEADVDGDIEMRMNEKEQEEQEPDFKREAAFALQNILAVGGDMQKARDIAEKWLVF